MVLSQLLVRLYNTLCIITPPSGTAHYNLGRVYKGGLVRTMLCHVFIVDWLFDYFDCFLSFITLTPC